MPKSSVKRDPKMLAKLEQAGSEIAARVVGKSFAARSGVVLKVHRIIRPLQDLTAPTLELVVPLVVTYEGAGNVELWSEVELKAEAAVAEVMGPMFSVALIRRTKMDPFKNDPRSLTMLRYRAEA